VAGDVARQSLRELGLGDFALGDPARLALQRWGQGATASANAVDVDDNFPMRLAGTALNALEAGLDPRRAIDSDVEAAFDRDRRLLERATRLKILVEGLHGDWSRNLLWHCQSSCYELVCSVKLYASASELPNRSPMISTT
jgi:hypothetical protein